MTMHSTVMRYVNLANTWESKIKAAEDWAASFDHLCIEATKREARLKEEMATLCKS